MKKLILCGLLASLSAFSSAWADTTEREASFPEPSRAWISKGTFVNRENLRQMNVDMPPQQIIALIGHPHFNEGLGLSTWNYIFNFRTGSGTEFVTCQYQVQFKDKRSVALLWRDPECANYIKPIGENQTQPLTLNADGLFTFAKSGLADLQAPGRARLAELVLSLKKGFSTVRSIGIVGYTDRIGSADGNMALSVARANTVKQYMVDQGIDGRLIQTSGMGAGKPIVFCQGVANPSVIACLAPNRRVEISINGDK
jgi:OOP family OmpA-OmpF porin